VVSLASKGDIDRFFQDKPKQEQQLIEMLYCQGGCHNGDGVRIANE
jgi:iron only hydrogenase large subunit-like protein